jgi:hypothetical protein
MTPFVIKSYIDIYTYILPLCFFLGFFGVLINFPYISECLHHKPLYISDLIIIQDDEVDTKFICWYGFTMNLILAIMITSFVDFFIVNGFIEIPFIKLTAIIGGNVSLYIKIQQIIGKVLIKICHCIKERTINLAKT